MITSEDLQVALDVINESGPEELLGWAVYVVEFACGSAHPAFNARAVRAGIGQSRSASWRFRRHISKTPGGWHKAMARSKSSSYGVRCLGSLASKGHSRSSDSRGAVGFSSTWGSYPDRPPRPRCGRVGPRRPPEGR